MKQFICTITACILFSFSALPQNLIPNCSFENRKECEFYNPSNMEGFAPMQCVADWESDSYGESSHLWFSWPNAKSGNNYASVLVYHPEARENRGYLQANLCQALQAGKTYHFKMFVRLESYCQFSSSNIGVYFSAERINLDDYSLLKLPPHIENDPDVFFADVDTWTPVEGSYTAKGNEQYLLIGNFYDDAHTAKKQVTKAQHKPYSSLYIDDVSLFTEGGTTDCCREPVAVAEPETPVQEEPQPEPKRMFTLENVYFDIDKAELMPESFEELNNILDILNEMDYEKIEVKGHTDNTGTEERNAALSHDRAKAVADYFIANGVDATVISYEGFGSSKPIASNDTDEGRKKNRRVEVLIH